MTKSEKIDLMRKASVAALEGYEARLWGNEGHGTAEQAAEANEYRGLMATAYVRGWNRADAHAELRPAFYEAAGRVLKMAMGCGALGHGEDTTDTQAMVTLCLRYADAVSDDGGAVSTGAPDQSPGLAANAVGSLVEALAEAENELREKADG